jgi:hypothetical protein
LMFSFSNIILLYTQPTYTELLRFLFFYIILGSYNFKNFALIIYAGPARHRNIQQKFEFVVFIFIGNEIIATNGYSFSTRVSK